MNLKQIQRFQKKMDYDVLTGCWLWKGALAKGYGQIVMDGKVVYAHRVSYEHWNGEIPIGFQIDHTCENPHCVNPAHLETVTQQENIRRQNRVSGIYHHESKKTHCPQGHEYSGENLIIVNNKRVCRTCKNVRQKEYKMTIFLSKHMEEL